MVMIQLGMVLAIVHLWRGFLRCICKPVWRMERQASR